MTAPSSKGTGKSTRPGGIVAIDTVSLERGLRMQWVLAYDGACGRCRALAERVVALGGGAAGGAEPARPGGGGLAGAGARSEGAVGTGVVRGRW